MAKKPKISNTTQFIDIADIQQELVLLKNNSLRAVVEVRSVNFDLKSNDEQIGIIRGFQDFLNALDFPLQIAVQSRKLDIKNYLDSLSRIEVQQFNDLLRLQIKEYQRFIKGLAELANIMRKRFFVVVPYYEIESVKEQSKGIGAKLKSLFAASQPSQKLTKEIIEKYRPQLEQRIGVIIGGLGPLGLQGKILNEAELTQLYYGYYNPEQPRLTQ